MRKNLNHLLTIAALLLAGCSLFTQELPNDPPQIEVSTADTLQVSRGGRVNLEVSASDEDDDPLGYTWSALGAGSFTDSLANITTWHAPDQISGNSEFFLLTVTISDHQPDTEDIVESFVVEVVQRIPVLVAPADTSISFREPQLTLEASATDEDGDPLTFIWQILEGERASVSDRQPEAGRSQATITTLIPTDLRLLLSVTDGSDTLSQEVQVGFQAPALPDGGTVTLERPVAAGTTSYEMDVYEYPNERGTVPYLVTNWFEAYALCEARGMRLCSSAEWQNACEGPQGLKYSSPDDLEALPESFGLRFCNTEGSDLAGEGEEAVAPGPSGSFPNCSNPEMGVYDLTGNAFEWVMDIDIFNGRVGGVHLSNAEFTFDCQTFSTNQPIPFADELDLSDQAAVDSLLAQPTHAGYGVSGRGFRCCRTP